LIEKFKGEGGAIFTQPQGIIKCAGGMSYSTLFGFLQEELPGRENENLEESHERKS